MSGQPHDSQLARRVGRRLRLARLGQRRQQTVVAGLAGITTDYLYQIERGLKLPSLTVLIELARVLDLPISALLTDETPSSPPRVTSVPKRGTVPAGARLYAAMTMAPSEAAEPPEFALGQEIDRAWRAWQHSPTRYSDVGTVAPRLVASVEQQLRLAAGDEVAQRAVAGTASDLYGLLRSFCKRTGQIELSLLSAERAIRTAELADDPLRLAAARWNLAHVLLADGQVDGAEDLAMTASNALPGMRSPQHSAMRGSLLLIAAVAAARRGDVWVARHRVAEADLLARRTGELNTCWTAFGPTNVAMHAATVELLTGHATEGLNIAEGIDHRAATSIERRVAFLLDQANGWRQRRDNAQVLLLLLEVEREAPEDMRYRPAGHHLVQYLVKQGRRSVAEQAANLATRLGVPV